MSRILTGGGISRRLASSLFAPLGYKGTGARYSVTSPVPTITFGTNTSAVNGSYVNGATLYNAQSTVFTKSGSVFVASTAAGGFPVFTPSHITDINGAKSAGNSPVRYRFMTDATSIDFCFLDSLFSQFNIVVDGQYIARDRTAVFSNTGNYRYINLNFGTDAITYSKAITSYVISAAGTGHAVGDIVTFDGGSGAAGGTPLTMKVAQVGGGTVTALDVVAKGAYTSQPGGTFTQVSSTGAGIGLTVGAAFFHQDHSTRRIRTIELIYSQPTVFLGIVALANDAVLPAPTLSNAPLTAFVGDSITNGTYLQYGGAHIGSSIAQKLGWWDRHIISGIGGTGWNAGSTPWSNANRVQDYIDYNADVYVFIGSQNDGSASAALEAAVTRTLNALLAARPTAVVIGIGNILGDSTSLANSIGNGYAAVAYPTRVRYINNHTPQKWIPTGSIPTWTVTSDANHLNQSGMDRFAEIAAPRISEAYLALTAA